MARKVNEYRPRKPPFWVHGSPESKRIWYINEARRKRECESRACSCRRSLKKGEPEDD